ncbi:MAG: DNA repair protein RadA [Tissierellia bacterium]|nr:DNA repair protein RadA [Tissierellia bacterium]
MKSQFVCQECGAIFPKWMGKCSECGSWNSLLEEVVDKKKVVASVIATEARPIKDIEISEDSRTSSGIGELDRVLGGGIVQGSLILVGGDPGIGKSTLLLQMAHHVAKEGRRVLYVSAEESPLQIKLRASRLEIEGRDILLLSETSLEKILPTIEKEKPDVLIMDSIQTLSTQNLSAAPGSVSQVREITSILMDLAKNKGIATFIVGHVTKSGTLAGPKVLEHMVDTVLYFEGDGSSVYRILRGVKNRFGSTNEVGLFHMTSLGLKEVDNPSEMFLSSTPSFEPGTVVFPSIEGTRPLLVEIQSLVSATNFASPRRMALGVDHNKLVLAIAILEKKRNLFLQNQDIYVNAVGGIQIGEPALTLPMMVSIASSLLDQALPKKMIILGEVGLLGEVRSVPQIEKRLLEAKRLGYERAMIPDSDVKVKGMRIDKVKHVDEVFSILFTK